MTTESTTSVTGVVLTDAAAAKAKSLLEQEGNDALRLRVQVQPGGCSGLRYQLFFDDRSLDGDKLAGYDGFEVVVDRIDAQGFTIDNPNAQGSCACGDSFH